LVQLMAAGRDGVLSPATSCHGKTVTASVQRR
jgi:hypothetical protein